MKFLIITHVRHIQKDGKIFGYGPYIKEMNLWIKNACEVLILAPLEHSGIKAIDLPYEHERIKFIQVPSLQLTSFRELLKSLVKLPFVFFKVLLAMKSANHIHLRCPGNMGLVGSVAQIFFPKKQKTAKYAGNWDWNSPQPWSYRWQQKILQNTFLTKNMHVLVYGNWPGATHNIKPFFTATYHESEKAETPVRDIARSPLKLIFVGGLNEGKQPLLSVKVCEKMLKQMPTTLHVYGEGDQRGTIETYIAERQLYNSVFVHGNQSAEVVKKAMHESHFLIFISKSEGWPKVVAEAMFWGCVPITTAVSCVPDMVGNGKRGSLVEPDIDQICKIISEYVEEPNKYARQAKEAMEWSRAFTLDRFEAEIKKLLNK